MIPGRFDIFRRVRWVSFSTLGIQVRSGAFSTLRRRIVDFSQGAISRVNARQSVIHAGFVSHLRMNVVKVHTISSFTYLLVSNLGSRFRPCVVTLIRFDWMHSYFQQRTIQTHYGRSTSRTILICSLFVTITRGIGQYIHVNRILRVNSMTFGVQPFFIRRVGTFTRLS